MRRSVLGSVSGIDIGTEHKPAIRTAQNNCRILVNSQLPVCGIRYGWMRLADDPSSHNRRRNRGIKGVIKSQPPIW